MPDYVVQATSANTQNQNEIAFDVELFRDGTSITVIRCRYNAAAGNQAIIDDVRGKVLRHAKVDAGIIDANRADELAEAISGRTFTL